MVLKEASRCCSPWPRRTPTNEPARPSATWNEATNGMICIYKLHGRVVVGEEVTKDLCFPLGARGREEGREAHGFEDEKGGWRTWKHRKAPTPVAPVASRQPIALLSCVDVAIPELRGGMIQRDDRKEWVRREAKA
jgi:hypothetical protein